MNLYVASDKMFLTYHLVLDGCFKFKLGTYGTSVNCKEWLDRVQSGMHLERTRNKVDVVFEYSESEQIISLIANAQKIAPDNTNYLVKYEPIDDNRCYVVLQGINVWAIEIPYSHYKVVEKLGGLLGQEIVGSNELQMICDILQIID